MNKIICDICGTQYSDTAEQCPICGYAHNSVGQTVPTERSPGNVPMRESSARSKGGRFSASNVRKHGENPPVYQQRQPEPARQPTRKVSHYDRAEPDSNPFLVVLLVVVIILLLTTTAFIFFRYFLPNFGHEAPAQPTEQTQTTSESTESVQDDTIPCEALALTSGGSIEFLSEGEMRLLNVVVIPSDSTDELTYASSDESVATVNSEGRVTAVGEGEAVITIICGKREMQCYVTCVFPTPTEETEQTEQTAATDESTAQEETE